MRWIGHFFERVLIVCCAILFLQFPLFIVAYQHQLLGHIHELHWQVESMEKNAKQTNQSTTGYINKFLFHQDRDFSNQGKIMNQVYIRWKNFTADHEALQQATALTKLFVFIQHINFEIAKSTWHSFQVGFLLNSESLIYALLGILFGAALNFLALSLFKASCKAAQTRTR